MATLSYYEYVQHLAQGTPDLRWGLQVLLLIIIIKEMVSVKTPCNPNKKNTTQHKSIFKINAKFYETMKEDRVDNKTLFMPGINPISNRACYNTVAFLAIKACVSQTLLPKVAIEGTDTQIPGQGCDL